MKKRLIVIAVALVSVVLLSSGPATLKAKAGPARVTYYTVHYRCILGPQPPDVVGEWEEDCDGNWNGWGNMPGDGCTETTVTYGERCWNTNP